MATNRLCVVITEEGGLFVGGKKDDIFHLYRGQKVKETIWKDKPHGLDDFFHNHPEERTGVFKALHYWALCSLGRLKPDEKAYGLIKRKLHEHGKKLYRRVKNFARSIAALFKKAFPSEGKIKKIEEKFLLFVATH